MSRHITREMPIGQVKVVDRLPVHRQSLMIALHILRGGTVPAIKCQQMPTGWFKVKDGRHRYVAHKLLGLPTIRISYGIPPSVPKDGGS